MAQLPATQLYFTNSVDSSSPLSFHTHTHTHTHTRTLQAYFEQSEISKKVLGFAAKLQAPAVGARREREREIREQNREREREREREQRGSLESFTHARRFFVLAHALFLQGWVGMSHPGMCLR